MAGTTDGQLKARQFKARQLEAGQLAASAFAKSKQGGKKARECGSTGARTAPVEAIR
jgi:hypothetical protein